MESFAAGVVGSVVAALIFLVLASTVRPRIQISPSIAKEPSSIVGAEDEYRFKVVNKSRRTCIDVDVFAYVVTTNDIPTEKDGKFGVRRYMIPMDLRRHQGTMLPGYRRSDDNSKYAHQVRFDESAVIELEKATKSAFILVRVIAKDGWSGFPAMAEQEFRLSNQIKNGKFAAGRSLKVVD